MTEKKLKLNGDELNYTLHFNATITDILQAWVSLKLSFYYLESIFDTSKCVCICLCTRMKYCVRETRSNRKHLHTKELNIENPRDIKFHRLLLVVGS